MNFEHKPALSLKEHLDRADKQFLEAYKIAIEAARNRGARSVTTKDLLRGYLSNEDTLLSRAVKESLGDLFGQLKQELGLSVEADATYKSNNTSIPLSRNLELIIRQNNTAIIPLIYYCYENKVEFALILEKYSLEADDLVKEIKEYRV